MKKIERIWLNNGQELVLNLGLRKQEGIKKQYAITDKHLYLVEGAVVPHMVREHLSDMFRYGLESYKARLRKGHKVSVARAGNSGHNWGISIDVDLKGLFSSNKDFFYGGWSENVKLLREYMAGYGWSYINNEEWHFNWLGINNLWADFSLLSNGIIAIDIEKALSNMDHRGYKAVVNMINTIYDFSLEDKEIQGLLNRAARITGDSRLNCGVVDGIVGRKTRAAISRFKEVFGYSENSNTWKRALISVCAIPSKDILEEG